MAVGGGQRVGEQGEQAQALAEAQGAAAQALAEVLSIEPLHRQVGLARGGAAVRDVRDDVRVAQRREDLGLAREVLGDERRARVAVQELQRRGSALDPIAGPVDHGHTAFAHGGLDDEALIEQRSSGQVRSHGDRWTD